MSCDFDRSVHAGLQAFKPEALSSNSLTARKSFCIVSAHSSITCLMHVISIDIAQQGPQKQQQKQQNSKTAAVLKEKQASEAAS